ncbi:hypothetical protein KUTeg_021114 [Tegillarca granosa]|uniref:Uncharacterized protein n=1 Tax=Tegillarca granosa TaxID=220873 RepID=A0ABQ9EEZ9_TEGGR|nr:hypothetical protein KUTeg_021114 [Tegillarca granosa]
MSSDICLYPEPQIGLSHGSLGGPYVTWFSQMEVAQLLDRDSILHVGDGIVVLLTFKVPGIGLSGKLWMAVKVKQALTVIMEPNDVPTIYINSFYKDLYMIRPLMKIRRHFIGIQLRASFSGWHVNRFWLLNREMCEGFTFYFILFLFI